MKSESTQTKKLLGIIIIACASAITILNINLGAEPSNSILPFILLMFGIIILNQKTVKQKPVNQMNMRKRIIVISTLSISLVVGIVVFVVSLL